MDSNSLITTMKALYDYFDNRQRNAYTSGVLFDKDASPEEKTIVQAEVLLPEGAKDALRMLARELELNVDYNTLEKK